jgi:hypothetical protein
MTAKSRRTRRSGYLQAEIICSTENCGHTTILIFHGEGPYAAFRTEDPQWTFVGDDGKGETTFLCTECGEPLRKEFEEQVARDEKLRGE